LDSSASFTFDEACLAELGRTGGEDACQGMANERLSCSFNDGLCTCTGVTEPEQETIRTDFVLSGHEVTIGPNLGEPIAGPYCVDGDQLVIQGPTGWAYWVLERVDNV
jgi:hypothetical protein